MEPNEQMDPRIPTAEENDLDYACKLSKDCGMQCARIGRENSPTWFSGWVEGDLFDCPSYQPVDTELNIFKYTKE